MAKRNYVLFDNYEGYDYEEYESYEVIVDLQAEDWDNMKRELDDDFGNSQLLVVGTVGLWNGNFAAGKLCKDVDEIFTGVLTDCDYRKVWYENGHLYIRGSHHDGTNEYEIKKVTDRGLDYYDNWNYEQDSRLKDYSEREIHQRMWNSSKYTHLV